jgi:excisionase family DNA binding protein
MLDDCVTTWRAARNLGWTEEAVLRLVHDGELPAIRLPNGGHIIPGRAVNEFARVLDRCIGIDGSEAFRTGVEEPVLIRKIHLAPPQRE